MPGARARLAGDLVLTGEADPKKSYRFRLTPAPGWLSAIRLELLPDPRVRGRFVRGRTRGVPVKLAADLGPRRVRPRSRKLTFDRSDANAKGKTFSNGQADLNIAQPGMRRRRT